MTRQSEPATLAIRLMDSPRGREAAEGGYYLRLFGWTYGEIIRGRVPAGVPRELVEEWRKPVINNENNACTNGTNC